MSLYQVQKLIYQLNRDPRTRERYAAERDAVLAEYELTTRRRGRSCSPISACSTCWASTASS